MPISLSLAVGSKQRDKLQLGGVVKLDMTGCDAATYSSKIGLPGSIRQWRR
jgi:hypothetical protein